MPESNLTSILHDLQEAAGRGDWQRLDEVSFLLLSLPIPEGEAAMAQYLVALQASTVAARTVRADIVKSLHRLSAASSFNLCG